jgi:hypothetical protein
MVVISAFQLPSIDVAAAALGVALRSSLIALPWSDVRVAALSPGSLLCV